MTTPDRHDVARWLAPVALYTAAFFLLTFPAGTHFSTHFFADSGDGLQNVWNLWWIDHAVKNGSNPWFTSFLHFPTGATLIPQTLNPFNGFAALALNSWLPLVQVHNCVVAFSFVVGGSTAYALARHEQMTTAGSLLAGFVFTFSSYHFSHAEGHLQLVSLEWVPLFFLLFLRLLDKPTRTRGLAAGASLFLVQMCDLYYFVFCVIAGIVIVAYRIVERREAILSVKNLREGGATFVATCLLACGPWIYALLRLSRNDPLTGAHDPNEFSMDMLAPWIPGGHWRFAELTQEFWQRLPGNIHESSVYWGIATTCLAVGAFAFRPHKTKSMGLWVALVVFFTAMAWGPRLQVAGYQSSVPGPFVALMWLIPPLRLGGCPVRMSVIVSLALAILAGHGLSHLLAKRSYKLASFLVALVVFEIWPRPIPLTDARAPALAVQLKTLDSQFGLLDVDHAIRPSFGLFLQTIHQLPMAHGMLTRTPLSLAIDDLAIDALASAGRWQKLCEEWGIRYFMFDDSHIPSGDLQSATATMRVDGHAIYDAQQHWACGSKTLRPRALHRVTFARQQTAGGACMVDTINQQPIDASVAHSMSRNDPLMLSGWAVDVGSTSTPPVVSLRLEADNGTGYEQPAARTLRPDLVEHFGSAAYAQGGIHVMASLAALDPGIYALKVVQGDKENATLCDLHATVSIQ